MADGERYNCWACGEDITARVNAARQESPIPFAKSFASTPTQPASGSQPRRIVVECSKGDLNVFVF